MMLVKSPSTNKNVQSNRRKIEHPFGVFTNGNGTNGTKGAPSAKKSSSPKTKIKIAPAKLILWTVLIGVFGFLYITHVFKTQQMLQEVNQIRLEHERVRMIYEERALTYNRMIGPAEIYARAKEQGFVDSSPSDLVLEVRRN